MITSSKKTLFPLFKVRNMGESSPLILSKFPSIPSGVESIDKTEGVVAHDFLDKTVRNGLTTCGERGK